MDPAVSLNLNTTIGAFQIGVLISYVLFGVTTTQTYIYYSRFPDDSRKVKALVAFVWVCEIAHVLCIGHGLYIYTISNYGHPERIVGALPKSGAAAPFLQGVVVACVQGFFSLRIYALSKKPYIPILSWVLSLWRLGGGIALSTTALRMTSLPGYAMQWKWLLNTTWIVSAANDVIIAATLVFLLLRQRSYGQKRTVFLVDKIILWTVETGILTSASAIITLITFMTVKENFIWIAMFVISTELFSNSLLASLNSRATLRAMNEVSLPLSMPTINDVQMSKPTLIVCDIEPTHSD